MTVFLQINGTSMITQYDSENSKLIQHKRFNKVSNDLTEDFIRKQKKNKLPTYNIVMHRLFLSSDVVTESKKLSHQFINRNLDQSGSKVAFKQYLTIVNSLPQISPRPSLPSTLPSTIERVEPPIPKLSRIKNLPTLLEPKSFKKSAKKITSLNLVPLNLNDASKELEIKLRKSSFSQQAAIKLETKDVENEKFYADNEAKKTSNNYQSNSDNNLKENKNDFLSEYYELIKNRKLILIDEKKDKYINHDFKFNK